MPRQKTRIKDLYTGGDRSRVYTVRMFPPPEDKLDTIEREYRYEFLDPPRQMDDQVIKFISKTIRQLRKKRMLFAAANIWPRNLDSTLLLWLNPVGGATKLCAFTQALQKFPLTAEIRIARGAR